MQPLLFATFELFPCFHAFSLVPNPILNSICLNFICIGTSSYSLHVPLSFVQSFFRSSKGKAVITHQSDVWSGCVTMMNVLVGKKTNSEAHTQVNLFILLT